MTKTGAGTIRKWSQTPLLPSNQCGAPGDAAADRRQADEIAGLDLAPGLGEVAELAVSCPEMVEEPEIVSLPVTERFAPTVALPPALMFWEVVMNPVLVIPLAVVVP